MFIHIKKVYTLSTSIFRSLDGVFFFFFADTPVIKQILIKSTVIDSFNTYVYFKSLKKISLNDITCI